MKVHPNLRVMKSINEWVQDKSYSREYLCPRDKIFVMAAIMIVDCRRTKCIMRTHFDCYVSLYEYQQMAAGVPTAYIAYYATAVTCI